MVDKVAQPVMKQALTDQWDDLDEMVRSHYGLRPGRSSTLTISGTMEEVFHSRIAKLFLLPARLFGALIPYRGRDIPTVVINQTRQDDSHAMYWHRSLQFPGRPATVFRSRMVHLRDDEIVEYVRLGLGIRMGLSVEDGALVFRSRGYIWSLGWFNLPIPDWLLLGQAEIIERAIDDETFRIDFDITHPLFGRTFGYSGTFTIVDHGE